MHPCKRTTPDRLDACCQRDHDRPWHSSCVCCVLQVDIGFLRLNLVDLKTALVPKPAWLQSEISQRLPSLASDLYNLFIGDVHLATNTLQSHATCAEEYVEQLRFLDGLEVCDSIAAILFMIALRAPSGAPSLPRLNLKSGSLIDVTLLQMDKVSDQSKLRLEAACKQDCRAHFAARLIHSGGTAISVLLLDVMPLHFDSTVSFMNAPICN